MQVISYEELRKIEPEYVKMQILECVGMAVQVLLDDEVFEKALSLLVMSDDEEEIVAFFMTHWDRLLDRILQEDQEKFYRFALWFFKEFEEFSDLNLERIVLLQKVLELVEKANITVTSCDVDSTSCAGKRNSKKTEKIIYN